MFDESQTAQRPIVARICRSARAEAQAAAAMLRSMGHLYQLRLRESGERDDWSTDTTEAVGAEIAAALRISQGLATNHTPSAALRDFVRCRDLTCRFPGCDRAAVGCDVDHAIPYDDGGPTQASNLKCLCRIQCWVNHPSSGLCSPSVSS